MHTPSRSFPLPSRSSVAPEMTKSFFYTTQYCADREYWSVRKRLWSRLTQPPRPSDFQPPQKGEASDKPLTVRFWIQRISTWLTFLLLLVPLCSPPVVDWALMTVQSPGQPRSFVGTFGACNEGSQYVTFPFAERDIERPTVLLSSSVGVISGAMSRTSLILKRQSPAT